MDFSLPQVGVMVLVFGFAGMVDAIVGGGGLVTVPALFGMFPTAAPGTLLGTNKASAIAGTAWSTWQYAKRVRLPSKRLIGAFIMAMAGSSFGAWLSTQIPSGQFRSALPPVLTAVWLYTLWRKEFGQHHTPHWSPVAETLIATLIGATIGLYDGIFGPGTGSFFIFALVRLLGWDFLHASAAAKRLNLSTNAAALAFYIPHGHVAWALAIPLGLANIAGSNLGTRLALKHGSGFVRIVFLVVVGALICKTGYDAWLR